MSGKTKFLLATTSIKGGCGKSFLAKALIDHLRSIGSRIAAYDGDGAVGTLSAMHAERDADGQLLEPQDPLSGVAAYSIRDETREAFINSLAKAERLILHDIGGGALESMQSILDDRDGFDNLGRVLHDLGVVLVHIHAVTPDDATVDSVARYLDLSDALGDLGEHVCHVAVLNLQGRRKERDFPTWFGFKDRDGRQRGGKTRARLLAGGGAEISMPALNEGTAAQIAALGIPFAAAVTDPRLSLVDQQRVRNFREDFAKALTPKARELMGLDE